MIRHLISLMLSLTLVCPVSWGKTSKSPNQLRPIEKMFSLVKSPENLFRLMAATAKTRRDHTVLEFLAKKSKGKSFPKVIVSNQSSLQLKGMPKPITHLGGRKFKVGKTIWQANEKLDLSANMVSLYRAISKSKPQKTSSLSFFPHAFAEEGFPLDPNAEFRRFSDIVENEDVEDIQNQKKLLVALSSSAVEIAMATGILVAGLSGFMGGPLLGTLTTAGALVWSGIIGWNVYKKLKLISENQGYIDQFTCREKGDRYTGVVMNTVSGQKLELKLDTDSIGRPASIIVVMGGKERARYFLDGSKSPDDWRFTELMSGDLDLSKTERDGLLSAVQAASTFCNSDDRTFKKVNDLFAEFQSGSSSSYQPETTYPSGNR